MPSLFDLADEVAVELGYTLDDRRLNRTAIAYNIRIAVDKLRDQIITKSLSSDSRQVADMLSVFPAVTATYHEATSAADWSYHSFVLPASLYSLPYDGGLAWVRYSDNDIPPNCPPSIAGAPFTHTTLGALSNLYCLAYQSPAPLRPYVARDKDRVYLYGCQPQMNKVMVGLYAALPDFETMDPNAPVDIPAEYLGAVKKMVIDNTSFTLQLPLLRKNDGVTPSVPEARQTPRVSRMMSINDPANLEG